MAIRPETKKKRSTFGIPKEIVLLAAGEGVWRYTFSADDAGGLGGCGRVPVRSDATVEDAQAVIFRQLADLTRTVHGVEIDVAWSSLAPDSWAGHVRHGPGRPLLPPDA
ncbi:hypothetical protein OTB20_36885 [Streptomyces sp. H27-H1]|uniref:hypothetical protein n=1 Tax=Streptomyces sp. H27-H1 TaxID=2996461 RepID=UPI002270B396|nr:hypothetical protein [Streptomyces sp. H27-H1]MCY0931663.1 hypothetical protein [Streptomyces sp. H27-H1]